VLAGKKFSSASDIWSLGVILWELCNIQNIPYEEISEENHQVQK
jgi:hypothetical protein